MVVGSSRNGGQSSRKGRIPRGGVISGATLFAILLVAVGWLRREESNLIADEGLGYALGITGLSCMALLLLYSVRKRVRLLRGSGRISSWFQIHMLLGLAGPVALLYHCNFQLGSLNSNVALFCALIVSASGVVGRLIYTRIYLGLTDRRRTLDDMREEVNEARALIGKGVYMHELSGILSEFEERVTREKRGGFERFFSYLSIGWTSLRVRRDALRCLSRLKAGTSEIEEDSAALRGSIRRYVGAVRSIETLSVYERFFALWHVMHLPLAFLLYVSATVHVIAVHMY